MPVEAAARDGFPSTIRVDRDGGLLSHLSIWENLVLPLDYHARSIRHLAEDATLLFALCGEDETSARRLLQRYPDQLSSYERRLCGFVRAMLLEPELLVLCDILDGLSHREQEQALHWETVFHWRFPFRTLSFPERDEMLAAELGHSR